MVTILTHKPLLYIVKNDAIHLDIGFIHLFDRIHQLPLYRVIVSCDHQHLVSVLR